MLPYLSLPPIDLSALGLGELDWFAVFVFAAVVAGVWAYDRAIARGGDVEPKSARVLPEIVLAGGLIGAHLAHVLVYHPELTREDPWVLLKLWAGISSVGGFAGGAAAGALYLRRRRQALVPYADRIVFGLTVGWIFGRLGCAFAHDHPGRRTELWIGVAYPDGTRHDLGLYELALTVFVLLPLLLVLTRRSWRGGVPLGAWLLVYGVARFGLDFLRATDRGLVDARYLGLTPAQYVAVVMLAAGVAVLRLARVRRGPLQPPLWGGHGGRRSATANVV